MFNISVFFREVVRDFSPCYIALIYFSCVKLLFESLQSIHKIFIFRDQVELISLDSLFNTALDV